MKKTVLCLMAVFLVLSGCGGGGANQGGDEGGPQAQNLSRPKALQVPQRKRSITTVGFLEPVVSEKAAEEVNRVGDHLSYVAVFSYRARADGSLEGVDDGAAIRAIERSGSVPMMVLTNFAEGNFSPDVAHSVFTDRDASRRLIRNVLDTMKAKGYQALNIDFEHIRPEDRELYNGFLETIIPAVRKAGYPVTTALAPKNEDTRAGAWHGAHDYKRHGELADFVILMTYEWGWSGGPPMAVSPIPQIREVLDYAVTAIPREKIVMGAPLYGYDWTLPYRKGGPWAKRLAPQKAAELAAARGVQVAYDDTAQAPYFHYTDDAGKKHVVWFENEASMQAKYDLVNEYRLRGVAYWVLGEPFPQNWTLLRRNFYIRKAWAR
ncbi:MAG TPA: glycosyl hydrolase family 18 protein [Paenibacillaceae bacterium]